MQLVGNAWLIGLFFAPGSPSPQIPIQFNHVAIVMLELEEEIQRKTSTFFRAEHRAID